MAAEYPLADPYYLHGSEQPGQSLVTEKLTTSNYTDWSRAIHNALGAKNKVGFIDGSIEEPEVMDPMFWPWTRCNIMVLSWLQQSVEPGIRKTIMGLKNAQDAWESLKARYGQGDVIRIAELLEQLSNLKQGNQTVTEYYGSIITLRDELRNYQPLFNCDCTATSHLDCLAMRKVYVYEDTNNVIHFLRGLNENFSGPRTQVLFGDELPNIDKVVQRMIQHERQLYGTQLKGSNEPMTMLAPSYNINYAGQQAAQPGGFRPGPQKGKNLFCTFCKMQNHTVDRCFFKIGFPPGVTPRPMPQQGPRQQYGPRPSYAANHGAFKPQVHAASQSSEGGNIQLTQDQFSQLMNAVRLKDPAAQPGTSQTPGSHKPTALMYSAGKYCCSSFMHSTPNEIIWIVDTGASDHVVSSLNLMESSKQIDALMITLPTGQQVQATHSGTVLINDTLSLHNVLYVPDFAFNLISVSRLTAQQPLRLTFSSTHCVLQDLSRNTTIGLAELHKGLYKLTTCKPISHIASTQRNKPFDL